MLGQVGTSCRNLLLEMETVFTITFKCLHKEFCNRLNIYLMLHLSDKLKRIIVVTGWKKVKYLTQFLMSYRGFNNCIKKWSECYEACWRLHLLYGFLWETELLKYRCTVYIPAASLHGLQKGLAVPCSTLLSGCFQFFNFQSCPAKNQWLVARVYSDLVVIYFVKILHVTCSTLKLVMYS